MNIPPENHVGDIKYYTTQCIKAGLWIPMTFMRILVWISLYADPDPTFHFDEDIALRPSCQKVNDGKARATFTRNVKICARHDVN